MKRNIHHPHPAHFIILLGLMFVFALAMYLLNPQPQLQTGVAAIMGLTYIIWGTLHHYKEKDLHIDVFIEYTLVALLGTTILISVIQFI